MYSVWLMAFWLFSVEVTNSPVNAQLMQSPKGSFVSVLFPTAWSTDRHWPQLPYADRSLNCLDLLDACRNAHGLQGENKKKKKKNAEIKYSALKGAWGTKSMRSGFDSSVNSECFDVNGVNKARL